MKIILQKILALLARKIIKKYQPRVVGITGSIGKTSAKEAVFAVLNKKFRVRQNIKNYNNELGVPLTIIGAKSKGKSIFGWFVVFIKAIKLLITKDGKYPEVLVLEMGADKIGDISYLVEIVKPNISVVTKVSATHLEFFKSLEGVAREKSKIVTALTDSDTAILNFDDKLVMGMKDKTKAKVITFGHKEEADVSAIEFSSATQGTVVKGINFKIKYEGSTVPVFLPHVVGAHQMNAALIGAAVGLALGMNLVDISDGLGSYRSPKGRMNVIAGIKNSTLIDDTYNSSPEAAHKAVESIAKLNLDNLGRKIAILGDMLELGDVSEKEHLDLGKKVAELKYDMLIAVGTFKDDIASGAKKAGFENVVTFSDSTRAIEEVSNLIQDNDLILVKGSQGSRMERIVKKLMAEPEKAKELLIRQEKEWID
jgi:UDP-N-acetylmuramoyl-tripeptide--D-alanyl-D-alanine ligase